MNALAIAHQISDAADDFLAGIVRRDEARAGIAEYVTIHYPKLSTADKRAVVDQTLAILDREGFFDSEPGDASHTRADFDNDE